MDDFFNVLFVFLFAGVFVAACCALFIAGSAIIRRKRQAQARLFHPPQSAEDFFTGQAPLPRKKIPRIALDIEDKGLVGAVEKVFSLAVLQPALYPLRQPVYIGMSMRSAVEACSHIKQANDIIGLIDNRKGDLGSVVNAVTVDPMLSVAVLKQANSARYGLSGGAKSLKTAIETIGYSGLRDILYREYLVREYKGVAIPDTCLLDTLWQHSILTGAIAGAISSLFPGMDRSLAYTAGLLHDIGKFILVRSKKLELSTESCLLPYCVLGLRDNMRQWLLDHAVVGQEAANAWGLNPVIGRLIVMHHQLEQKSIQQLGVEQPVAEQLVVLHVANQLAKHYSLEPRQSNYLVPVHFSFHKMVNRNRLLNVLSAPEFCEEVERVREMRL